MFPHLLAETKKGSIFETFRLMYKMSRCPARGTILTFDKCQLVRCGALCAEASTCLNIQGRVCRLMQISQTFWKVQEIHEKGTSHDLGQQ